jgi:hypothetical protein
MFHLNEAAEGITASELPSEYSQKAVHLTNVNNEAAWYLPTDDSFVESIVPIPGRAVIPSETPIAFSKLGEGRIGYIGGVNAEEGSSKVVLAMLKSTR